MRPRFRKVTFAIDRQGRLERRVELPNGRSYTQRATLKTLKEVAAFVEQRGETGPKTQEMWDALRHLPATQASLSLQFLVERGCMVVDGRRNYAALAEAVRGGDRQGSDSNPPADPPLPAP
ncbi:MAG: hypothetical protein HYS13_23945 [Planctomycetia bacterium]|nr:hypothetical protein [Planctomycetia bacterium]